MSALLLLLDEPSGISLPGTLPSPGTLTSGQSASFAAQSAGGSFALSVPVTGTGTLTATVDGGTPVTLTGSPATGTVTLPSGAATLTLAVTGGSITLLDGIVVTGPITTKTYHTALRLPNATDTVTLRILSGSPVTVTTAAVSNAGILPVDSAGHHIIRAASGPGLVLRRV